MVFLKNIEKIIGKKANKSYYGMQLGDVHKTHASIKKLNKKIRYKPKMKLSKGIERFIQWYKEYYNIKH